ncbi:hypothetical protein HCB17_23035 [Salinispora arenicola]|uniref:DUF6229 family protein n=1 Tax=Salinispora arenicola TaxID=168697 RepID=UPI00037F638C|nr:DUF6229 family protein [Salinispora arenicola]NIL43680.1 hypothetical protein [Salinispora arenicola]
MPPVASPDIDISSAEEIINRWLSDTSLDGSDSPAGPLFTGGRYVVQEITATAVANWTYCSACTGSGPGTHCC